MVGGSGGGGGWWVVVVGVGVGVQTNVYLLTNVIMDAGPPNLQLSL